MNLLIKSATILDLSSTHHNKTKDILIENGCISAIADTIKNPHKYKEVTIKNLHVSQGWFDSSVCFGAPGYEERETFKNGLKTAALSGFTTIALQPNTQPVIDNAALLSFVKNNTALHAVTVHPIGALTKNSKGNDLAELYDMTQSGAVAFGDYQSPVTNPNMLKIALQYTQSFNGLVLSYPQDNNIAGKGVVNEDEVATRLGLKGIPSLAEELQVARDLFLLEYTDGKLHIPTISTEKSVTLIREAKAKGLNVSCSVSIANLLLTDAKLTDFETCFKLLPPLRSESDRKALITGVKDGTIDFVTSNHTPIDVENKKIAFDHALYGSIGLESMFGALNTIFSTEKTIEILTQHKSRFGEESSSVTEGQKACLSLFIPDEAYTFSKEDILSTSKNSVFLGMPLKGKPVGVYNNNQLVKKQL